MRCLGVISGAGGLPQHSHFSCACAALVPVAPAVGAVLLYLWLVPRWHRVPCDVRVACWLDACTAAWLGLCCLWCSIVGLRCWASICRAFVPLVGSCSSFGFPAHTYFHHCVSFGPFKHQNLKSLSHEEHASLCTLFKRGVSCQHNLPLALLSIKTFPHPASPACNFLASQSPNAMSPIMDHTNSGAARCYAQSSHRR